MERHARDERWSVHVVHRESIWTWHFFSDIVPLERFARMNNGVLKHFSIFRFFLPLLLIKDSSFLKFVEQFFEWHVD